MTLRNLQGTDLKVSRACFGTMTFGGQVDESLAVRMVDKCLDSGVNFFDSANVYQQGASEQILGKALQGKRGQIVLATKVGMKVSDSPEQERLSREAIVESIEASLRRLQTDYVDLYYLHQPDYGVPIEETLEVLQDLVLQGKVRYTAISNYASWQTVQMLCLSQRNSYQPPTVAQQMYNVLARGLEQEFLPMSQSLGVSVIAYNPLAGGLLTGKHRAEAFTPSTRFDNNLMYQDRYWHDPNFKAVERLGLAAENNGRSLISLSLNWLLHHTVSDCVILGASKMDQLEQNLSVLEDGPLTPEMLNVIDEVWRELRGSTPVYNR